VVAIGAIVALLVPGRRRNQAEVATIRVPVTVPAPSIPQPVDHDRPSRRDTEAACVPV
jgi:hypothetical protein